MRKVIGFFVGMALSSCLCISNVYSQFPSCWTSATPPDDSLHHYVNPDSVMVDTCNGSATYHHRFATRWFRIEFKKIIFNIPADSNIDTVIDRSWRDIDTNEFTIRAGFDSVELHFGTFIFQKAFPDAGDTVNLQSQIFLLKFDNYIDIDSAQALLKSIPSVNAYYQDRALGLLGVKSLDDNKPQFLASTITTRFLRMLYPSISSKRIHIYDMEGRNQTMNIHFEQVSTDITDADCNLLQDGFYFVIIDGKAERFLLAK